MLDQANIANKITWLQVSLTTEVSKAEDYSDCLTACGAVSVTLQDAEDTPLFEPTPGTTPLWAKTRVIGLFDASIDISMVKAYLKNQLGINRIEITPLEDKNWVRAWMDQFHPMWFGEKLWICPSFREPPDPTAINIMLDPGMAFGTGTHPTTRLCLEWLDKHPPKNALVVDYGCGSGILSIAALKLGASFVYAVDHDFQALESTKNNASQNGFHETNLTLLLPEHLTLPRKADLLLANILANPLVELAPTFATLVKENGIMVLSGILENQIEMITKAYQAWFKIVDITNQEGWVRISVVRLS